MKEKKKRSVTKRKTQNILQKILFTENFSYRENVARYAERAIAISILRYVQRIMEAFVRPVDRQSD